MRKLARFIVSDSLSPNKVPWRFPPARITMSVSGSVLRRSGTVEGIGTYDPPSRAPMIVTDRWPGFA